MSKQQKGFVRNSLLIRGAMTVALVSLGATMTAQAQNANMAAATKWVNTEFQPSTLSKAQQRLQAESAEG